MSRLNDIPLNDEARLIQQLIIANQDIDTQILELAKAQANNNAIIKNADSLAQWTTQAQLDAQQANLGS